MSKINITVLNDHKLHNLNRLLSRKDIEGKTIEQVKQENPILYFNNGNKKNESVEVTDQRIVKKILNLVGKELIEPKNLLIGSMWDNCNGKWWNQFTIRTYTDTPVIGNTFFHSTGQPEYDYMIDEIIGLINKSTIVLDFKNIIQELDNKNIKLCFIKDKGLFIEDIQKNLYKIENYWHGSYLDKLIKDGIIVKFSLIDATNIEDWEKEIWGISEVKAFMERQSLNIA